MKYYINKNKEIFGFESDGSQDNLITKDMKPISLEEIQAINQLNDDNFKQSLEYKLKEAQFLLDSTQFKFGDDYDKKNTPEWEELKLKRAEAREIIRSQK